MTFFSRAKSYREFTPQGYRPPTDAAHDIKIEEVLRELEALLPTPRSEGKPDVARGVFERAKQCWERLGVQPENIEAFRAFIGQKSFDRFIEKTMLLVDLAHLEGHDDEAQDLLKRIVHKKMNGSWYKLDDTATLHRNVYGYCRPSPYFSIAATFFEDLREFLRADILAASSTKKVEREGNEAMLWSSCWRNDANAVFDIEAPEIVTVKEGENADIPITFTSNAHINNVEVSWHVADRDFEEEQVRFQLSRMPTSTPIEDFFSTRQFRTYGQGERQFQVHEYQFGLQSLDPLHLIFSADRDLNSHKQRMIPIVLEVMPRDMPDLKVRKIVFVKIENQNEGPSVAITAPSHVEEGKEVCFKVHATDPEEDLLAREWSFKGRDLASLSPHTTDQGDLCVTPPATGRFEFPLDAQLTVRDLVDSERQPILQSQSASASARVFIDPVLSLPTGEKVKPSSSVVEVMSDPEIAKATTASVSTDKHLYVFLRLPTPMERFTLPFPPADLAMSMAVQGDDISGDAPRPWTRFESVPSATHVAVSSSPIRKWIKEGMYHSPDPSLNIWDRAFGYVEVPLEGEFQVDSPEVTMTVAAETDCDGDDCHYRLRIANTTDADGKSFLQAAENVLAKVVAKQETRVGHVTLSHLTYGVRKDSDHPGELLYDVPVHWPEGYLSSAKVSLELTLHNRYNERGTITYSTHQAGSSSSLFDHLHFTVNPEVMPDPWFLVHMEGVERAFGNGAASLLPHTNMNFRICPPEEAKPFIPDCTGLGNQTHWNVAPRPDEILIPLRPYGSGALLSRAYRATGGTVTGGIHTYLQGDINWEATIDLPETPMIIAANPTLSFNWDEVLHMPQFAFLALLAVKKAFEKELEGMKKFGTEQRAVKPGERFVVNVALLPENRDRTALFIDMTGSIDELKKRMQVTLSPKDASRKDTNTLTPVSLRIVGRERLEVEFEVPSYLPAGHYSARLNALENIYANYRFHYGPPEKYFEKIIPTTIWGKEESSELPLLTITGNPTLPPPSATIEKTTP